MTTKPKLFYTLSEFAELFRVNLCTVHRWRKNGLVRVVKVGGRALVPASEVERLSKLPPDDEGGDGQ